MRRGQAMLETILAVIFLTALFLMLFYLSQRVQTRIILDHAAARVARARAVGFNDFMCEKIARVAVIPTAGKCLVPNGEDKGDILARVPIYLSSLTASRARGILDYERWGALKLSLNESDSVKATLRFADDESKGVAEIENHAPFYLFNQGL